jgi:hypothetical protein
MGLVPQLAPGDIVIRDELASHKGPTEREMIRAAGASLLCPPPRCLDRSSAFAKLKAPLRKAAERTVEGL